MALPPITRFYSSACFLTTLACQLEIVNPFQVRLSTTNVPCCGPALSAMCCSPLLALW
jgi:hypothetical protein